MLVDIETKKIISFKITIIKTLLWNFNKNEDVKVFKQPFVFIILF